MLFMNKIKLPLLFLLALFIHATGRAQISGPDTLCTYISATYTAPAPGGVWSSSSSAVVVMGSLTGVMMPVSAGPATITYMLSTLTYYTKDVEVVPTPVLTTTETPICGNHYKLNVAGALSYVWAPATGLACSTCDSIIITPTASVSYSVTGTGVGGCTTTNVVTVPGYNIMGYINFTGIAPSSPAAKVWLVQYDPTDSSITGLDSFISCTDAGNQYYEFPFKSPGNYLVKAKLLSAVPGTSDYVPTYGAGSTDWFSATPVVHGTINTWQDINMVYGTVPSGPGFISGYVYSGAGKGTAGDAPVEGMLVYLKNTTGQVLTYTYTDAAGHYSFTGLAYGSYVTYPVEQPFYTTPSDVITLSAGAPGFSSATFRQYLTSQVIRPYTTTSVFTAMSMQMNVGVYPNPAKNLVTIQTEQTVESAAQVQLLDITGRQVLSVHADINNKGLGQVDVSAIPAGMYVIKVKSDYLNYTGKLTIE